MWNNQVGRNISLRQPPRFVDDDPQTRRIIQGKLRFVKQSARARILISPRQVLRHGNRQGHDQKQHSPHSTATFSILASAIAPLCILAETEAREKCGPSAQLSPCTSANSLTRHMEAASKVWQFQEARITMAEAKQSNRVGDHFQVFATKMSFIVGTKWAFLASFLIIVAWASVGPTFQLFKYMATGHQHSYYDCDLPHGLF